MLYSSRNGCLFYYDPVLYGWRIAEPTLLFLLGFEAVTSYDKSESDNLTISKYTYLKYSDELVPLEYIEDIYDDIYSFLSEIGSVEDCEHYLTFNCFGLKTVINEITGTGNDRTVPIIFKSDTNRSLISPEKYTVRLTSAEKSNMSYYGLQANRIHDIFNDAGYDLSLNDQVNLTPDHYIVANRRNNDIIYYNSRLEAVHSERMSNSEIFRLLDYKAMYAYSLGVLYGCRCLGYDDRVIWRIDPKYWYTENYINLVRTSWWVFRFHWTDKIGDETSYNKYQSIQDNVLWNFDNSDQSVLHGVPLELDEIACFRLWVEDNAVKSFQFTYSNSKTSSITNTYKGSYLKSVYLSGSPEWVWQPIDKFIIPDGDSNIYGVASTKDEYITRYIGNDPVIIYEAYSYKDDEDSTKWLAHYDGDNAYNYFVYTGNVGWVTGFNENLYTSNYLSLAPKLLSFSNLHHAMQVNDTSKTIDESLPLFITYYSSNITDSVSLYGIYSIYLFDSDKIPDHFNLILSDEVFNSHYIDIDYTYNNVSIKQFYNLDSIVRLAIINSEYPYQAIFEPGDKLSIYINYPTESNLMQFRSPEYYGYTSSPSSEVVLYESSETDTPNEVTFRYYNNKYWSADYFNDTLLDRHFLSISSMSDTLYVKSGKTVNIYKGETVVRQNLSIYTNLTLGEEYKFVYTDYGLDHFRFVPIKNLSNNLYDSGVTTYPCKVIRTDSNSNPTVWFDNRLSKYWCGSWQSDISTLHS